MCVFHCVQVAPRLAIAALAVKEDRDARKSIRDLFSAGRHISTVYRVFLPVSVLLVAVLSVFSTPVSSGSETRSEIDHKQLQLR